MSELLAGDEDVRPLLAFIDEFVRQETSSPSAASVESLETSGTSSPSSASDRDASCADGLADSPPSGTSSSRVLGLSGDKRRRQEHLEECMDGERELLVADTSKAVRSASVARKKKLNPANSSTEVQRRKRAEIRALREQVAALEMHVTFLQRSCGGVSNALEGSGTRSLWQDRALFHSQERQRAELTNRKLKGILAGQHKLNDVFRSLLSKRSVLQDMDAVLGGEPVYRSPASVDYSSSIIERLEQQVEALYIGMEPRERRSMPTAASCMTESVRDQSRGQIIRVVTTTPMSCSMEESARLFWHHLTLQRDVPDKSYRFLRRINDEVIEKNFVMLMRDSENNFQINGLQFMRKYIERDRVVFVRANLLLLPTSGLRFQDRTCITISRVKDASVVESHYELNAETDELGASPSDLSYAQQVLLQKLSSNWRTFDQYLQSTLISEDLRRRASHAVF